MRKYFHFLLQAFHLFPRVPQFFLGHFLQIRVAEKFLGAVKPGLGSAVSAIGFRHRLQFLLLPGQAAEQVRVGVGRGVFHLADDSFQAVGNRLQFIHHGLLSPFPAPRTLARNSSRQKVEPTVLGRMLTADTLGVRTYKSI